MPELPCDSFGTGGVDTHTPIPYINLAETEDKGEPRVPAGYTPG